MQTRKRYVQSINAISLWAMFTTAFLGTHYICPDLVWCEKYLWYPFYRKLGQLIGLVLFFLCIFYAGLVAWLYKYTILVHILIILDRKHKLGLKVLYGDTGGFSSVPVLSLRFPRHGSHHTMWLPLCEVLRPGKEKSDHSWSLLVPLQYK